MKLEEIQSEHQVEMCFEKIVKTVFYGKFVKQHHWSISNWPKQYRHRDLRDHPALRWQVDKKCDPNSTHWSNYFFYSQHLSYIISFRTPYCKVLVNCTSTSIHTYWKYLSSFWKASLLFLLEHLILKTQIVLLLGESQGMFPCCLCTS